MPTDNIAIRVHNLDRSRERYHTLRDAIVNSTKMPFKRSNRDPPTEKFCILKDVSFDMEQGEVLEIIGQNRTGKSTLLKILSRVTTPTDGTVELHGWGMSEMGLQWYIAWLNKINICIR